MEDNILVTPWQSPEEWQTVKKFVNGGKFVQAQQYIEIWKGRCHKLDAGEL